MDRAPPSTHLSPMGFALGIWDHQIDWDNGDVPRMLVGGDQKERANCSLIRGEADRDPAAAAVIDHDTRRLDIESGKHGRLPEVSMIM